MTTYATTDEKAEIGQLMLELTDVKRELDGKRDKQAQQAERLSRLGEQIHDDAKWPSPDEYHQTRKEGDLSVGAEGPGDPDEASGLRGPGRARRSWSSVYAEAASLSPTHHEMMTFETGSMASHVQMLPASSGGCWAVSTRFSLQ